MPLRYLPCWGSVSLFLRTFFGQEETFTKFKAARISFSSLFTGGDFPAAALEQISAAVRQKTLRQKMLSFFSLNSLRRVVCSRYGFHLGFQFGRTCDVGTHSRKRLGERKYKFCSSRFIQANHPNRCFFPDVLAFARNPDQPLKRLKLAAWLDLGFSLKYFGTIPSQVRSTQCLTHKKECPIAGQPVPGYTQGPWTVCFQWLLQGLGTSRVCKIRSEPDATTSTYGTSWSKGPFPFVFLSSLI